MTQKLMTVMPRKTTATHKNLIAIRRAISTMFEAIRQLAVRINHARQMETPRFLLLTSPAPLDKYLLPNAVGL
jgi:hypothetical protein